MERYHLHTQGLWGVFSLPTRLNDAGRRVFSRTCNFKPGEGTIAQVGIGLRLFGLTKSGLVRQTNIDVIGWKTNPPNY